MEADVGYWEGLGVSRNKETSHWILLPKESLKSALYESWYQVDTVVAWINEK